MTFKEDAKEMNTHLDIQYILYTVHVEESLIKKDIKEIQKYSK